MQTRINDINKEKINYIKFNILYVYVHTWVCKWKDHRPRGHTSTF